MSQCREGSESSGGCRDVAVAGIDALVNQAVRLSLPYTIPITALKMICINEFITRTWHRAGDDVEDAARKVRCDPRRGDAHRRRYWVALKAFA